MARIAGVTNAAITPPKGITMLATELMTANAMLPPP
jgi:hypothetical protein